MIGARVDRSGTIHLLIMSTDEKSDVIVRIIGYLTNDSRTRLAGSTLLVGIGGVTHIYGWEVREQRKWKDLVVKHFEESTFHDEDMRSLEKFH